jgi:hypothetical protein
LSVVGCVLFVLVLITLWLCGCHGRILLSCFKRRPRMPKPKPAAAGVEQPSFLDLAADEDARARESQQDGDCEQVDAGGGSAATPRRIDAFESRLSELTAEVSGKSMSPSEKVEEESAQIELCMMAQSELSLPTPPPPPPQPPAFEHNSSSSFVRPSELRPSEAAAEDATEGDETADQWFYFDLSNEQKGPVTAASLWALWRDDGSGEVHDGTYVWCAAACEEWTPLHQSRLKALRAADSLFFDE